MSSLSRVYNIVWRTNLERTWWQVAQALPCPFQCEPLHRSPLLPSSVCLSNPGLSFVNTFKCNYTRLSNLPAHSGAQIFNSQSVFRSYWRPVLAHPRRTAVNKDGWCAFEWFLPPRRFRSSWSLCMLNHNPGPKQRSSMLLVHSIISIPVELIIPNPGIYKEREKWEKNCWFAVPFHLSRSNSAKPNLPCLISTFLTWSRKVSYFSLIKCVTLPKSLKKSSMSSTRQSEGRLPRNTRDISRATLTLRHVEMTMAKAKVKVQEHPWHLWGNSLMASV